MTALPVCSKHRTSCRDCFTCVQQAQQDTGPAGVTASPACSKQGKAQDTLGLQASRSKYTYTS